MNNNNNNNNQVLVILAAYQRRLAFLEGIITPEQQQQLRDFINRDLDDQRIIQEAQRQQAAQQQQNAAPRGRGGRGGRGRGRAGNNNNINNNRPREGNLPHFLVKLILPLENYPITRPKNIFTILFGKDGTQGRNNKDSISWHDGLDSRVNAKYNGFPAILLDKIFSNPFWNKPQRPHQVENKKLYKMFPVDVDDGFVSFCENLYNGEFSYFTTKLLMWTHNAQRGVKLTQAEVEEFNTSLLVDEAQYLNNNTHHLWICRLCGDRNVLLPPPQQNACPNENCPCNIMANNNNNNGDENNNNINLFQPMTDENGNMLDETSMIGSPTPASMKQSFDTYDERLAVTNPFKCACPGDDDKEKVHDPRNGQLRREGGRFEVFKCSKCHVQAPAPSRKEDTFFEWARMKNCVDESYNHEKIREAAQREANEAARIAADENQNNNENAVQQDGEVNDNNNDQEEVNEENNNENENQEDVPQGQDDENENEENNNNDEEDENEGNMPVPDNDANNNNKENDNQDVPLPEVKEEVKNDEVKQEHDANNNNNNDESDRSSSEYSRDGSDDSESDEDNNNNKKRNTIVHQQRNTVVHRQEQQPQNNNNNNAMMPVGNQNNNVPAKKKLPGVSGVIANSMKRF